MTSSNKKYFKKQKQIESLLSQKTTLLSEIKAISWSGLPYGMYLMPLYRESFP